MIDTVDRHLFNQLGYLHASTPIEEPLRRSLLDDAERLGADDPVRRDDAGALYWVGDVFQRSPAARSLIDQCLLPLWQGLLGDAVELLLNRHNCFRWSTQAAPAFRHRDSAGGGGKPLISITYLAASNPDNGCTMIVPGSHLSVLEPPCPERFEVPVVADAGDTLCFDADLLHRSSPHRSGPRRTSLLFAVRAPDDLSTERGSSAVALTGDSPYRGNAHRPWTAP